MLEFFKRLFGGEQSGVTARERLRLVLLSDHLSLAPDVVESLRADLIAVISKYVEVDEANCDVSFEQQDRAVAVLANIPILALRDRRPPPGEPPPPPPPSSPPVRTDAPPREDAFGPALVAEERAEEGGDAGEETPAGSPARRRRRRRRAAANAASAVS
jgi:cell division topological specificity factor